MKALIIDDEIDICHLLSWILKQKKVQAICVHNLLDAMDQLNLYKPGIVFLDNHLPDGLGIEFIETIKKVCLSAKIIMITAHDTNIDKQLAIANGADVFIGKPFSKDCINKEIDIITSLKCIPNL